MAVEKNANVMLTPGMFEVRTVRGVKLERPVWDFPEFTEYSGWVWLNGERVRVRIGRWGDATIWEVDRRQTGQPLPRRRRTTNG